MPNYIRPRVTGATIFFTVCLQDRSSSLLTDEIDTLRASVRKTKAERPFDIIAMVVLPDHLHCVLRLPAGDRDFGRRWGAIKGRFSASVRRAGLVPPLPLNLPGGGENPALRKGQAGIWQNRFWEHHIRNEEDLANHIRYCHINPVKHGLVAHPEDWPWSSIHRDVGRGYPRRSLRNERAKAG